MSDSNVIKLTQPGAFSDSLAEILRNGARALLGQAIEAEVAEFLAKHAHLKTAAIGDRTRFGAVELIVRDMQGHTVTQVGVELDPAPKHPWRSWLRLLRQRLT